MVTFPVAHVCDDIAFPHRFFMATQVITFPAAYGTTISAQQPNVQLTIPNDGAVYDLSQSRVRVTMSVADQTKAAWGGGNVIDRQVLYANGPQQPRLGLMNLGLVRHVKVSDQRHGVTDLRRYNNTMMTTLKHYTTSRHEKLGHGTSSLYGDADYGITRGGLFVEKHKTDHPSLPRHGVIDIPLSDLTDLARAGESRLWPTALSGETTFDLEMEPPDSFVAMADTGFIGGPAAVAVACVGPGNDPPDAGDTELETTSFVMADTSLPFYIGQPVVVRYQERGAGTQEAYMTNIAAQRWKQAPGGEPTAVYIELADGFGVDVQGGVNLHPFTDADAAGDLYTDAAAVAFVRVELQMVRVMSGTVPDDMAYFSYRLYDLSMNAVQQYTTTLQVDGSRTPNVFLMWQSGPMPSILDDAEYYRFSVDDEYEGPATRFHSSAHRELILRGFRNAGMQLRDMTEMVASNALANSTDAQRYDVGVGGTRLKLGVIPLHLKQPGEPQTVLQLELQYGNAGQRRLMIYGQQMSVITFRERGIDSGPGPAM
jgi:hypothetical protein